MVIWNVKQKMSSSLKNERSNFKSTKKKLRARKFKDRFEAKLLI